MSSGCPVKVCQTCGKNPAVYTCPACSIQSCSVGCVKAHKKNTGCDGLRKPDFECPRDKFDNYVMEKDLEFLSEVGSAIERNTRADSLRITESILTGQTSASKLRQRASQEGVTVKTCPPELSRRQQNTSTVVKKTNRLRWRIEWLFPLVQKRIIDPAIADSVVIADMLKRFFQHETQVEGTSKRRKLSKCDLAAYSRSTFDELWVLLEGDKVYHRVDVESSLAQNLYQKCITEFPTILVLKPDEVTESTVISSDGGKIVGRYNNINILSNEEACRNYMLWKTQTRSATDPPTPPLIHSEVQLENSTGKTDPVRSEEITDPAFVLPQENKLPHSSTVSPAERNTWTAQEGPLTVAKFPPAPVPPPQVPAAVPPPSTRTPFQALQQSCPPKAHPVVLPPAPPQITRRGPPPAPPIEKPQVLAPPLPPKPPRFCCRGVSASGYQTKIVLWRHSLDEL